MVVLVGGNSPAEIDVPPIAHGAGEVFRAHVENKTHEVIALGLLSLKVELMKTRISFQPSAMGTSGRKLTILGCKFQS